MSNALQTGIDLAKGKDMSYRTIHAPITGSDVADIAALLCAVFEIADKMGITPQQLTNIVKAFQSVPSVTGAKEQE